MKKLISETAWSRIYEDEGGLRIYESKFKTHGLLAEIEYVQLNWPQWNASERLDFAKAFSAKSEFSSQETSILEFLLKNGSEIIASTVANAFARCSDKQMAVDLIIARLRSASQPKANLFQALGKLGNEKAVPVLKEFHDALSGHLTQTEEAMDTILDYLACSASLALLTNESKYRHIVESYVTSGDQTIQGFAATLIELELGG